MRTRPGSDSRTGFLTSIQCLDDDDDIAFSLWRVLLRKCINTLWYGWFTRLFSVFSFYLRLFFIHFCSFHTIYVEIFEAGETGQWSLPFLHGFLCTHLQRSWVSVSASRRYNLFWSKSALIVTRVYSFCLELGFPVQKKTYSIKRGWVRPRHEPRWQPSCPGRHYRYREQLSPDQSEFRALLHPTPNVL